MLEHLKTFYTIAKEQGADIIELIFPKDIIFDIRTTYKCITCEKYGKKPTCPPFIPSTEYFETLINKYKYGLIIGKKYNYKTEKNYNNIRKESSSRIQKILLSLEQHAFSRNYYWAISFTGGSCKICEQCSANKICKNPSQGRIPLEGTGVDVIQTCKNKGINITPFPLNMNHGIMYRIGLFLLE